MVWKIILYVLFVATILWVGFWTSIVVILDGGAKFYALTIVIGGILLLVFTSLHLFRFVTSKNMKKIWLLFLSTILVSCAIHESVRAYDQSIPRIREKGIDLRLYEPYTKNTRTVALDTPSILKLETDLPVLDGATALYPVYSAFAQAVYPPKNYSVYDSEVVCNNTVRAYENLLNGSADVIFVASPSPAQSAAAEKAGISFRYTPIGKEAFVFFVNAQNPVDDLTVEQLQAIYSGTVKNWQELDGKHESIRPFQRNENSGSQTAFLRFMEGTPVMEPPMEDVIRAMDGMVSQAADYANYGNAIGFSFRFYVNEMVKNNEVKILKINGIYPDLNTIRDGTYPLASSFFAITLSDNNKPNVLKFLEWMVSEQGQYLVRETGYCNIPVYSPNIF